MRRLLLLLFVALLAYSKLALAIEIEVSKAASVISKKNGKVIKLGVAKVGRKFQSSGKIASGKYYKITVKGKAAFIPANSVQEKGGAVAEETSSESSTRSLTPYLEIGGAQTSSLGIAPHLGFFVPISLSNSFSIDLGAYTTYFLFNSAIKSLQVGAALRLSLVAGPIVLSPEVDYVFAHSTATGGLSSNLSSLNVGFFAAYAVTNGFHIVPGFRASFDDGFNASYYLNLRFLF